MTQAKFDHVLKELTWSRTLIRDLLEALPEEILNNQPIASAGSWAKQFRHIARVHENYVSALKTGAIGFGPEGCSYSETPTKTGLLNYFLRMEKFLKETLPQSKQTIDWSGEEWPIERHLQALVSHDVLHHGQLILYARAAKIKLPKSWQIWGE